MFSTEMITPFIESFFSKASVMDSYKERIAAARKAIAAADYVLIGAGAGLSAAAGLDYGGMRFKRKFSEFIERYGFTDLYTSSFYDFPTEEERWAYWAKHIDFARFAPPAMELYRDIFRLVDGKGVFCYYDQRGRAVPQGRICFRPSFRDAGRLCLPAMRLWLSFQTIQ